MNTELQTPVTTKITAKNERERITARVTPDVYATLNEAAQLSGTTLNSFMVQAALQQANDVIDAAKMRTIQVIDEAEAAWFLAKFQEKFTPNAKLAQALALYNGAIHADTTSDQSL